MATRTSKAKSLGKAQGWGIAQANADGSHTLVVIGFARDDIRALKREVYPGNAYKTVRVNATFQGYSK